ncbi:Neuropeptides capa receptor [Halotydeus destructor]|nr:Neuropeptides capa receptor [Halotydeus destructor]
MVDVSADIGNSSFNSSASSSVATVDIGGLEVGDEQPFLGTRDPLSTVIPMTILYAVILVTGLFGNICTCVVIARNKYMRTATNYYLFSLAISDLLLLMLGLPQEMYQLWWPTPYAFGDIFCVVRGLSSETSTNASVLTITSFTFERFLAICYPLKAHTMSKLSRVIKLIVIIWLTAALAAIPLAVQFGVQYVDDPVTGLAVPTHCTIMSPIRNSFEVSTAIFFVVPMTLILVLYLLIGIQLRRSESLSRRGCSSSPTKESLGGVHRGGQAAQSLLGTRGTMSVSGRGMYPKFKERRSWDRQSHGPQAGQSRPAPHSHSVSSRRAVVRMLIAVVVAFFVCWVPFHGQRLMATHVTSPTELQVTIFTILTYISGVTYYVSATINPILYSIMSLKFRQAFKDTMGACCGRNSAARRGQGPFGKFQSTSTSRRGTFGSSTHSRYGPHRDSVITGATSLAGSSLRSSRGHASRQASADHSGHVIGDVHNETELANFQNSLANVIRTGIGPRYSKCSTSGSSDSGLSRDNSLLC